MAASDPLEQLAQLERRYLSAIIAGAPDGVSKLTVTATGTANAHSLKVDSLIPFAPDDASMLALRELMLHLVRVGTPATKVMAKATLAPDGRWDAVVEYEYPKSS